MATVGNLEFTRRCLRCFSGRALMASVSFVLAFGPSSPKAQQSEGRNTANSIQVSTVVQGLENPWSLAFLPDDEGVLITERPGRLRIWTAQKGLSRAIQGTPAVFAKGQGGLLDVAIAPDFAKTRRVYLSYAEGSPRNPSEGPAGTAVGFGRLTDDGQRLEDFQVIFRQRPKLSNGVHFGSRLVFDDKGHLFIALGENNQRPTAQDLDKLQGKVVRLRPDGSIPEDNPFIGHDGALPEIWSYGHRNQQGAALNPWTKVLWTHEHGPRGGDEINIPGAGKNYGWPIATHGIDYSGLPIPEAKGETAPGTEPPHYVWKKSAGISGMAFYNADKFPLGRGSRRVGALGDRAVIRLSLDHDKRIGEERLLEDIGARIRDVRVGSDGYLWVLTDERDGRLLKVGLKP